MKAHRCVRFAPRQMAAFEDAEICRDMLENVPVALCVVDLQKRIVFWSSGAERVTGHLRHDASAPASEIGVLVSGQLFPLGVPGKGSGPGAFPREPGDRGSIFSASAHGAYSRELSLDQ